MYAAKRQSREPTAMCKVKLLNVTACKVYFGKMGAAYPPYNLIAHFAIFLISFLSLQTNFVAKLLCSNTAIFSEATLAPRIIFVVQFKLNLCYFFTVYARSVREIVSFSLDFRSSGSEIYHTSYSWIMYIPAR